MKMLIIYGILLTIIIVFTGQTTGIFLNGQELKYTPYTQSTFTCSKNMACKYAVCKWERRLEVNDKKCTFLDNHCSCPGYKICATSGHITSGSSVYFQYRCKDPVFLFEPYQRYQNQAGKSSSRSRPISLSRFQRFPYN